MESNTEQTANQPTSKTSELVPNQRPKKETRCHDYEWHHYNGGSVWGVLLILAGLTLILNYSGILPWSFWNALWQFWPVILILAGVQILLGNTPGSGFLLFIAAVAILGSVFIKALIEIQSPLIFTWGLNNLPWFNFLTTIKLR